MKTTTWAWYSVVVNVILAGINLAVAAVSGSLAVFAEMVHNLVDLASAVAVLVGIKLASQKTRGFPYGLYKLENVIAVAIALLIFFTAYEFARQALFAPVREITVNPWMLVGLALAAAIALAFSHFELRAGREARSPALIADAKEYRVHVLTTGIAFAAVTAQWWGSELDRVAALLIVLAIAKTGWDLLVEGMRVLLDASLEEATLTRVRGIVSSEPTVVEARKVTGRNAGRFRFVEIEAALRTNDLEKANATAHRIEWRIREAVPNVERVLVHVDPIEPTHLLYAVPLADGSGCLSEDFSNASLFALARVKRNGGVVEDRRILWNPHLMTNKAKGIRVAEWLVHQKVDVVLLRNEVEGEGPGYVFANAAIHVLRTEATSLDKALKDAGTSIPKT
jgi:cation diffusion facilitator family transporter